MEPNLYFCLADKKLPSLSKCNVDTLNNYVQQAFFKRQKKVFLTWVHYR